MIIDAHAHVFPYVSGINREGPTLGLSYGRVGISDRHIQVIPPLSPVTLHTSEMLIRHMDLAEVDHAVLLQGPFYGECNDFAMEAVRQHPDRLTAVAYFDPWSPAAKQQLEWICRTEKFVGVKIEFSFATGFSGIYPGVDLRNVELEWIWRDLEEHALVLVIDLGAIGSPSYQTEAVRQIAMRHKRLTVVIAHLGQPNPKAILDPASQVQWLKQIELGLLPNVHFDNAALPAYSPSEDYPFARAGEYLREAIRRIGPDKILWGTDVPALLTLATYRQLLTSTANALSEFGDQASAQVMGANAARVYRIRQIK